MREHNGLCGVSYILIGIGVGLRDKVISQIFVKIYEKMPFQTRKNKSSWILVKLFLNEILSIMSLIRPFMYNLLTVNGIIKSLKCRAFSPDDTKDTEQHCHKPVSLLVTRRTDVYIL